MTLLWTYLKQYRRTLGLALALATVNQVFSLLDPQIFQRIIDNYATKVGELATSDFLSGVGLLLLASVGVAFVSRVAKNFQDYYVNVIVQKVGTAMYSRSVAHSFSLPYAVFEDQRSGEFLQKLQKARTDAQALIQSSVNSVFLATVGILFVVTYAFTVHWAVGTTYFLILPTLGTATFFISRKIKATQQRINAETASLAGSTTETLRNVELVKSLGLERQEIGRLNRVNEAILGLELTKVKLVRKLSFIQGTLINALRSGLLLLMLFLVYEHAITLGHLFSLLFYSFAIFVPLGDLGTVAQNYQEARASLGRLDEILKTPAEERPAHPRSVEHITSVAFKKASFTYATASVPAVKDVSLSIASGKTVAFVGPSGSGKTTIVKLIVGLYAPTEGTVLVNDIPLPTVDIEALRARIGLVSQDTQLFAGTIRENLLFVRPSATDDECREAMRTAAAEQLLSRGGEGLDTRIGEGGLKLSGGEKQRLAIARALLRQPDLIIFDEATSSLDSLTEEEITKTIKDIREARPNLITILVAHRLSTVVHADAIVVLEKGHITETGTHTALLKKKGLYAALWRQQIASSDDE